MRQFYTWSIHDDYARYWTIEAIVSEELYDREYSDKNRINKLEKSNNAQLYLSLSSNPLNLDKWNPPIIKEDIDNDKGILKKGDFHSAWSYESNIVSQNMVDKLGSVLKEYGQLFPLEVEDRDDKLYRYWVTKEIPFECVDKEKGKFFDNDYSDDDVFKIEKLVLKEDCQVDAIIFRIKEEYKKTIFVSDEFIELVKKHNLKGFKFEIDTSYEYAVQNGSAILIG